MLICEGRTDYIYIETALRQLASSYPSLVSINKERVELKFKRFKDHKSHTAGTLGIKGGTGSFKTFIPSYKAEFKQFAAPGMMKEPVILLVDNDKAGREVLNVAKNGSGKKNGKRNKKKDMAKEECIHHVHRNLYLVLTPQCQGKDESKIEDLFDSSTLGIKIEGKSFNPSDEKATDSTYSKAVFARKVVEERASSISFEGFRPLLDAISQVIEEHYAQRRV